MVRALLDDVLHATDQRKTVNVLRQAAKDFVFSDGTFIPKGTLLKAAVIPMQRDPEFYDDPEVFKPWRFSDAREEQGDSAKHSAVHIDVDYLTFGYGHHTWCGGIGTNTNDFIMLTGLCL